MNPQTKTGPEPERARCPAVTFQFAALAALCLLVAPPMAAQEMSVVFEDDFSSNTIDPAKYAPDAPFFEGGKGDIHAEPGDGVMTFVGTTSQQWWSGSTLRIVPTFTATEDTPVAITIDRVAEAGQGTASRSALWIVDETRTKYVLFADVRAEGGWRYNRKIGEDGDVPTGSGTDIAAFNGAGFDDGGLHTMSMVANGSTVKLILDGEVGAEVSFPFSKVGFDFGSYARAEGDTADTTWDNLKIETVVRESNVVFSDDFSSDAIDPARYEPDAPFFEGGEGDIHAEPGNGVMTFVGTTTKQWWSGATLRIVPTFAPSETETISLSIDRVAEAGEGTASRSALWILDETKTRYVLFADVRAEGGWRYNRKIGEDGDVPTGSGTDIAAFNGPEFDDGGLHTMGMVADGKTVKLLLDGVQGAEVKFPFSPVIFEFGSYARADNDTASTTWDNLRIETAGGATFATTSLTAREGHLSPTVSVRIPQGLNSQGAINMRVISSDPSVAALEGGADGTLELIFPAGGANTATFRVRGVSLGTATLSLEGDIEGRNTMDVAITSGPVVALEENFSGSAIDSDKWEISNEPFEDGIGEFSVTPSNGALEISGLTSIQEWWGGASLKTKESYVATKDLNLVFEVDRKLINAFGTAARTGVFITTDDRSQFVFFSQNVDVDGGEWRVNVNPGNPTGDGTTLAAFSGADGIENYRMKLVADGETVEVFLDGVSGGSFPFPVSTGIHFEIGAYAWDFFDDVLGVFDNVVIENVLPCVGLSEENVSMTAADAGREVTVTIPQLLNDAETATVTITSNDPNVAVPAGGLNGSLTLEFAAGGPTSQTFTVAPVGLGATTMELTASGQACVAEPLKVEVVAVPQVLLTDDFSGASFDASNWVLDDAPFDNGTATPESALTLEDGQVKIDVTVESPLWPGLALRTVNTFSAESTAPVTFEIDRLELDFDLVTGTGAEQRTTVWVEDADGHSVSFSDYQAHDGRNYGWRYNKAIGDPDDDPVGAGVNAPSLDGGSFDDGGNHRVKLVANGATVKLYVDDVFGAEVPFPYAEGLTFGFGAYADEAGNVVRGYFDNARITGGSAPTPGRLAASISGANVVISWTGEGTLQSTDSLASPNWQDVTPAPAGKTITAAPAGTRFYRLRQ